MDSDLLTTTYLLDNQILCGVDRPTVLHLQMTFLFSRPTDAERIACRRTCIEHTIELSLKKCFRA